MNERTGRSELAALLVASCVLLLDYTAAAVLTVVPVYLLVAAFDSSYSLLPNTRHELRLFGILVAVVAAGSFISGVSRALALEQ